MKKRNRGFSTIDALLIGIIVISVGFVGYRVYRGSHPGEPAGSPLVKSPTTLPAAVINGAGIFRPEYSDQEWDKLLKDPAFKNRMLKRSSGCASAQQRTEWGIPITKRDLKTRPLMGNWRTWVVNEKIRCFEVGQTLHVVSFNRSRTEPAVIYSGTVTVSSIAELPLESYPQSIFDFFEVSRKDGVEYLKTHSLRTPTGMEMLIRTSDINKQVKPFVDPPHLLPSGKVITRNELASLKSSDIVIFDVRSPAEFQAGSLPKALNTPFGGSDPQASKFDPLITTDGLRRFSFDINLFNQNRNSTIVLVGSSEKDPRPLWASLVLFDFGFSNMVWVLDGVGSSPAVRR